jgi:hypothetical protein
MYEAGTYFLPSSSHQGTGPLGSDSRQLAGQAPTESPTRDLDPFRFEATRQQAVKSRVRAEALSVFGTFDNIAGMASTYFASVHHRVTLLSMHGFYQSLASQGDSPRPDFVTLCLSMRLSQEHPAPGQGSMHSSFYVRVKGIISLLDAVGCKSLHFVQARFLLAYYEMGHGLHPAVSVSIGACARHARAAGIHRRNIQGSASEDNALKLEEVRRTWWSIYNLDR